MVQLSPGAALGRYEIVDRIGSGGMAEVYLARLQSIGGFSKLVVVKVIQPKLLEDEDIVRMFLDEARIAGSLNHPNIAQVFEVDQVNGVPFLVMEYVRGPALSRLARRAAQIQELHYGHLATVLAGACRGLHHAHASTCGTGSPVGLVHRDVSPQNILVSADGTPKIIDFGVAKARERLTETEVGVLKGKLAYMAPEQLRGDQHVDHRADVYAVGVTLYRTTVGSAPFQDSTAQGLLRARLEDRFEPPSAVVPGYPPELERIVLWAMDADPDQRCGTCKELADALEAFAHAAGPGSDPEGVASWIARCFPGGESEWQARKTDIVPSGASSDHSRGRVAASLDRSSRAAPVETTPAPAASPRWPLALFAAVALGAAASGGAWLAWPEPQAAVAEQSNDDRVRAYLDEAERSLAAGDLAMSARLLEQATAVGPADPSLEVRLTRALRETERALLVAGARQALQHGDLDGAAAQARKLLDLDPSDADAFALLADVKAARGAAEAVSAPPGKVVIRSSPSGASVFLDDEPVGTTPLELEAAAGEHVLHLRMAGRQPEERRIEVKSAGEVLLDVALAAAAQRTATQAAAAAKALVEPQPAPEAAVAADAASPDAELAVPTPEASIEAEPVAAATEPSPPPEAAAAAATPAEAAPAPKLPVAGAALPEHVTARNVSEIRSVLASVERDAMAAGAPEQAANGSTGALIEEILMNYSPGREVDLYPRLLSQTIVELASAGKGRAAIGVELKRANRLAARGGAQ